MSGTRKREDLRIAIAGAGPGGLCAAIQLRKAGFENLVIFEKGDGVGGTWWHNRYPGAECDVPTDLYSFSFELKTDWSKPYGTQPEIKAYVEGVAEKYGLAPYLRLSTAVTSARWDEERAVWQVGTSAGDDAEFDVFISAMGLFNEQSRPSIPGLDEFRGTLFHSASWDHEHDLTGETVGVIGSAASAVQFLPEIAKQVGQLHVFQRTANWVLPKDDTPYTEEQLERFRAEPELVRRSREATYERLESFITFSDEEILAKSEAAGLAAIAQIEDPEVRKALTPTHPYGCKRPLLSNVYFPMYNRDNVELVTDPIERVTPTGVVTADGRERRCDTIVLATGFATTQFLSAIDVTGRGGRRIEDEWADGAQAYLGITTSGFPNLYMLYGPNTNNGSIITMIECQVDYLVRQVERLVEEDLRWLDVRGEVLEEYNEQVQQDIAKVDVWQADCFGYYRSPSGRVVTQWPHTMTEYRDRTSRPDPEAYETG